jgi:transketolase
MISSLAQNTDVTATTDLELLARRFRRQIFEFKTTAGTGHLASCLSIVDILVSMYIDKATPFDPKRDTVLFGKGHGSPAVYPVLAHLGVIPVDSLQHYCQPNGILRLHADATVPGCSYVGGSLGNALGFAAGLATANRQSQIWVILGDAELYEGAIWESLLHISHHKLSNLIVVIDRNGLGILGHTEDICALDSLRAKFQSFGFSVDEVNGHSFEELRQAFSQQSGTPRVLIAKTTKGKGVDFMEGIPEYHTIIPSSTTDIERGLASLS